MWKKWISLVLAALLLLGAAWAERTPETAPGAQMGFKLLHQLYVPGENRVISPVSLTAALAMAAEGAREETLQEILDALDAQNLDALRKAMPESIQSANALFSRPELELEEAYLETLKNDYSAQRFPIDAQVVEKVNDWVRENTNGLIDSLLSEAPDPQTALLLINAVALDAKWAYPFMAEATQEADFHTASGDVKVQMMQQTQTFDYLERDGMQMVCLPYEDGKLEMWVILPSESGDLAQALEALEAQGLSALTQDAQPYEVTLSLPKMDLSDENGLRQSLIALGIERAFSPDAAQFEGICAREKLYIDEILQKARIQVDEEGTRAAAATVVIARTTSIMPDVQRVEMRVDRPFAFAIVEPDSGAVCFAGAVENPAGSEA